MSVTPNPLSDPVRSLERLQEILDLNLLTGEEDEILQEALAEATDALNLPIGLVSLVLNDAQYFAAMHGVDGWLEESRGTPLEWSFCVNVVRSGDPFIVEDAMLHPKTRDNPMVPQEGVRSYVGVPLRTSKGQILGTFCVIGKEARKFEVEEVKTLEAWAERVMERIEERRHAPT